jgi:hypothetical protein
MHKIRGCGQIKEVELRGEYKTSLGLHCTAVDMKCYIDVECTFEARHTEGRYIKEVLRIRFIRFRLDITSGYQYLQALCYLSMNLISWYLYMKKCLAHQFKELTFILDKLGLGKEGTAGGGGE